MKDQVNLKATIRIPRKPIYKKELNLIWKHLKQVWSPQERNWKKDKIQGEEEEEKDQSFGPLSLSLIC